MTIFLEAIKITNFHFIVFIFHFIVRHIHSQCVLFYKSFILLYGYSKKKKTKVNELRLVK